MPSFFWITKYPILQLLVSVCMVSTVYAADHLVPISNDRILIDGSLTEWNQMRRHSAEYLVKGMIADMNDFQGGVRIAFNSDWLFIALDCRDSDLKTGGRGDKAVVSLQSKGKKRVDLGFSFIGRRKAQTEVLFTLNRKRLNIGKVVAQFDKGTGYTLEAKIPMSQFPWVYGSEVKLAAIFTDKDSDGSRSIFATHLVDRKGFADDVSYIFGGAQLYRSMYEQHQPSFKVITEINHDWVDDQRDELLLISDSEIVIFGEQIRKGHGYIRYVHGWQEPSKISARIEGEKSQSKLIIEHTPQDGMLVQTEVFMLVEQQLTKVQ